MEPSEMTDEQLDAALEGKEPTNEEAAPEEPSVAEVEEAPTEEAPVESPVAEEAPAEEPKPSRRESLRIQKLLQDNAELRKQAPAPKVEGLDFKTALDADPEVVKQIEAEATRRAELAYGEGLEQTKSIQFHTRLEIDAPKIESKYPQLDPKSPDFNAATADAINTMYLKTVGYDQSSDRVQNPNIRYADYVESMMELAEEMAGNKAVESSKNIAKQAASTALRPDGSVVKRLNLNKAPDDPTLTYEELEAIIEQGIPTKRR